MLLAALLALALQQPITSEAPSMLKVFLLN